MKYSVDGLSTLLKQSVVELKFPRRRPKPGSPATRRMLCTNSTLIFESVIGASTFRFQPPQQSPKYNPRAKGLVIAYDLFMLDYRAVNATDAEVITVFPLTSDEKQQEFWEYFNENIRPMSAADKQKFMNS